MQQFNRDIAWDVGRAVSAPLNGRGGSSCPAPPRIAAGEYYLTDENGNYLTDENGNYLIGKDA